MDATPEQRFFMLVGRLVVEDGMCADEAEEMAAVIWGACRRIEDQKSFEDDVLADIEAL